MIHVEAKIKFIEMIDISVPFLSLSVGISRLRPKNDHNTQIHISSTLQNSYDDDVGGPLQDVS